VSPSPIPPDSTRLFAAGPPAVGSEVETRLQKLAESDSTHVGEATPTPLVNPLPAKYTFLGVLGRGGMGEVLHAYDTELQRHVAVKYMRQQAAMSPVARRRFLEEARILAQLDHPNVVRVFERGEIDGRPYFAMEYLAGLSLGDRRGEFRTSAARAVAVTTEVAAGVQHAHEHGVFHRDLKASNVVFHDGRPVVADFGCARWEDGELSTQGFAILGTPSHLAPEVWEHGSKDHDERADLWALGVMLYQLLAGELPFAADPRSEAGRTKLLTEDPAPIASSPTATPGVDDRLEAVVRKALAKNPADRHPSVAAFAAELEEWLSVAPPTPSTPTTGEQPRNRLPSLRRRGWVVLITLGLASVVVAAALLLSPRTKPIEERVKAGSVTIIDDHGTLVEKLTFLDGATGGISKQGEACELTSGGYGLAEFFSAEVAPPVRVSADVFHHTGEVGSEAGLYVACRRHQNDNLAVYLFTIDTRADGRGRQAPPGAVFAGGQWFTLTRGNASASDLTGPRVQRQMPRLPRDTDDKADQYHRLVIEIDTDRVTSTIDGVLLARPTWVELDRRTQEREQLAGRNFPRPLFGSGIGLYVDSGTALFKNVVIEPILTP
jgi:serine/threonine protein kinase